MFLYSLEDDDKYSTGNVKGGRFQNVHKADFPALQGMALHRLSMEPGTLNPPHWHTNSHEIVYVISGKGLFGIRGIDKTGEAPDEDVFEAGPGDVIFIELNYSHWFKSIGEENLEVAVWFTSENPTTLGLISSLRGVPDAEVAQAYGVPTQTVVGFNTDTVNLLAGEVSEEELSGFPTSSKFKFNIADSTNVDRQPGAGTVTKVTTQEFTEMKDFTFAHIEVERGGMRQIHWHQFPNELNLVLEGHGEFGVVTPDNESFVYPVSSGDVIMAPVGYSHYAVNRGPKPFKFLLGFDHQDIGGIDVRQVLENMRPSSVREQTLKVASEKIDQLSTASVSMVPPIVETPS